MHTSITTFFAPKTAGNSIICLNSAIHRQRQQPGKKILCLQLTSYPDIHLLAGIKPTHSLYDLLPFYDTSEWQTSLLTKIVKTQGVDIIQSPIEARWSDLDHDKFMAMMKLIQNTYDEVFIDLNQSCPPLIFQWALTHAARLILTSFVDPTSQEATKNFLTSHASTLPSTALIFNQCSADVLTAIKKNLPADTNLLGALPTDINNIWLQIYEGFPVMFQKKSKLKTALEKLSF